MKNMEFTKKGFTLIEMLLVVSMAGMAMTMSMPAYHNVARGVSLKNAGQQVQNDLRLAQQRSVSSNGMIAHGVRFNADDYVSFGGDWAAPAYAEARRLPPGHSFSAGAGTAVVFSRHSGLAAPALIKIKNSAGTEITLRITDGGGLILE